MNIELLLTTFCVIFLVLWIKFLLWSEDVKVRWQSVVLGKQPCGPDAELIAFHNARGREQVSLTGWKTEDEPGQAYRCKRWPDGSVLDIEVRK